jgi:hypothetical protein
LINGEGAAVALDVNGYIKVNVVTGGSSTSQGTYNITPPTLSDTATNSVQLDVNGNLKTVEQQAAAAEDNTNQVIAYAVRPLSTSTYSWTRFQNYGANTTLNIKASAGNIFSLYAYQTNAAARFEQIHNTATTPAGNAVPTHSFLVSPSGSTLIDSSFFGLSGDNHTTGLAFAHSTTFGIYVAGTAADGNRVIMFK